MSESLYNLSAELAVINDELSEKEGVLDEDLEARMDAITIPFNSKIEGIVRWTKNIESKEDMLDKEISRLQARKKSASNLQVRLKAYMKMCMERADKTKIELDTFTVSLAKNPPSVNIINPEAVPAQYTTIKTEVVINKGRILENMKAGEKVPGCELIENKTNLRVR